MKATDFTLAWMQKFDFDGHPYKFSKIDVDDTANITTNLFEAYQNYTTSQLDNVMVVLSDSIVLYNNQSIISLFEDGEIIYLSTLLQKLSAANICFAYLREELAAAQFSAVVSSKRYLFSRLAGTFYIFDFNDNPV